jgi:hypothetical protein
MIEAADDSFIPTVSRIALREALEEGSRSRGFRFEHVAMPGDHVQPGSDRLITELLQRVVAWMGREGQV